jgi:hypothetical protein
VKIPGRYSGDFLDGDGVPSVDKGTHGFSPQICGSAALLPPGVCPVLGAGVPLAIEGMCGAGLLDDNGREGRTGYLFFLENDKNMEKVPKQELTLIRTLVRIILYAV